MNGQDRVYVHEDVNIESGRIKNYMPNQGKEWSFSEGIQWKLVGMFGQLRPFGRWPRGLNLWETDWDNLCRQLEEQWGPQVLKRYEKWYQDAVIDRSGGWDQVLLPGPGSPDLSEIAQGEPLPCVVQQEIRLRHGAKNDYLAWYVEEAKPAVAEAGWKPLMWFSSLHSPNVTTLVAAPDWGRLHQLKEALPEPDPSFQAIAGTSAFESWSESPYLKRP